MDILIFILAWTFWSLFYTLSQPANDKLSEIIVSTWLWTCLSVWITLIIYDILHKELTCIWIALLSWALWTNYTSWVGKTIINKFIKWEKKKP